ncbi:MAG: gamma-glutamyltransferase [Alphaproteobacteria bacterium]|nr:gamma-glutamyltransferase [Alphaproteobacteria bacterium]
MPEQTGRPVTLAPNAMVTSPHSLASAAGLDVLRAGGSAVDAAIATSAALAVLYPHMTTIGGDAFWLIHEAGTGKIRYLSGGGRAVAGGNLDAMAARGHDTIPIRGIVPATLTVPGALASWVEAHDSYGKLPMARLLESAIGYARDGFPVTDRLAFNIGANRDFLAGTAETAAILLPGGEVPAPGSRIVNPDLARTLEAFAANGFDGFYRGEVAQELVRASDALGGLFTLDDLASASASWGEPISTTYRGVTVYNTPPPTQGLTTLQMLNLVEGFDLPGMEFLGPDHIHAMVEAKQFAFHDRDLHLADPAFADVPLDRLLSKDYAAERAGLIDMSRATPWDAVPSYGTLDGDTVFMSVADSDGNAVALIQSLYAAFGSGVVAGNTGVMLQNRGSYFSLDPDHPNRLEPGKVPAHTLIASMAKRNDRLWSVLGCQGADGQPQIQFQLYVDMIDFGLNIQEALETPRFLSGRISLNEPRDELHVEGRMPEATVAALADRGHRMDVWPAWNNRAGHASGIVFEHANGVLCGGADPRSDGAALGF